MKRSSGASPTDHKFVRSYLAVDSHGRVTAVYMCIAGTPPKICRVHPGGTEADLKGGRR